MYVSVWVIIIAGVVLGSTWLCRSHKDWAVPLSVGLAAGMLILGMMALSGAVRWIETPDRLPASSSTPTPSRTTTR